MAEETENDSYSGCPCDRLGFPDDDDPISSPDGNFPELPEYADEGMNTLLPCIVCNRTFNPAALERHRKVCEKLSSKARDVFSSTKKRLDYLDVPQGLRTKATPLPKAKSRWREKRAEFLRAIRAAKNTPEDGEGHVPTDYIQCPCCARYFGPKAADRHIQWCREQKNRLPKYTTSDDTEAVNRLKVRTKYIPPRPGQSGWRAPKKKDVISSIPPQNVGPNLTPPGRLITPPLPSHRHSSPPPISPSRKGSAASLPPGPPRYHTGSLGRTAGKQFASMLQSVTGCPTGYGLSSGYGTSAMYGAPSGLSTPTYGRSSPFQRTSSLRLPRKRYGGSQKMARHRDLASDMLASVTVGSKAKRLDPEGDEDCNIPYEHVPSKLDDALYDPFSAAEMQFQALLGPTKNPRRKHGLSYGSGMLGSTGSLRHGLKRDSPERDYVMPSYKPRSTSLGGAYHTLSLLGLDTYDLSGQTGDSSVENSPTELQSPEENLEDILSQFDSFKSPHFSPSRSPFQHSPSRSPSRFSPSRSPSRFSPSRSPSRFSPSRFSPSRNIHSSTDRNYNMDNIIPYKQNSPKNSFRSRNIEPFGDLIASLEETAGNRKPADGANLRRKSPSPGSNLNKFSNKEMSPLRASFKSPSSGRKNDKFKEFNGNTASYGWTNHSDLGSPNTYSRHLGTKNAINANSHGRGTLYAASSAYDSIKALKASLDEDLLSEKKSFDRLDDNQHRASSGSSTDSSLPPLSSPPSSVSMADQKSSATSSSVSQLTRFCHECGHKYPVSMAKFCCQCGARRINVGD